MRVADYIFSFLANRGVDTVFMVSGGGAMYLDDAIGRRTDMQYVCNLHEQACAMAAEGYARVREGMPGVVCVTTGPGGTNAVTGILGAWLDSIPLIVISGQVKRETMISRMPELKLRQLGDQEADIVSIVRSITKYAAVVMEPECIRHELEKAWHLAVSGRPGPVWLDIPLDVQAAEISENDLAPWVGKLPSRLGNMVETRKVFEWLAHSERPVMVVGNGIRLAGAVGRFRKVVEKLKIPVLTALSGIDLIESEAPYFFGRPGILGERPANFILQNADLILIIGTRMNLRQIGFNYSSFGRAARKVMVDIDPAELGKPTLNIDEPICRDAGEFLKELEACGELPPKPQWLAYAARLKRRYPVVLPKYRAAKQWVNSYVFAEELSCCLRGEEIIVTGNGIAYTSLFQAISLKAGNRMFGNVGCASMGYGLPAAIGAACAAPGRRVICVTGDGSLQMNLQELQTLVTYRLPVKLFVFNNGGYLSIKHTQRSFFGGHFVGSDASSGVVLPSLEGLAAAYKLPFYRLRRNKEAVSMLPKLLEMEGAVLVEVLMDPFETVGPKAASKRLPDGRMISAPLEDLAPFLPRKEFFECMLIPPCRESLEADEITKKEETR